MTTRRPRNIVSRTAALAVRAAELFDEGRTDAAVAAALNAEFGRTGADRISAGTVKSFRHDGSPGGYARVRAERNDRREAAAEAQMIIESARDAGSTFAQAGTDLLSRMFYDLIRAGRGLEPKDLIGLGKTLAKFREIDIAQLRAETDAQVKSAAARIKDAVADRKLSGEELVAVVDEIMGIRK